MRIASTSYDDVADRLGVDPVTVRNWERRGMPRVARLAFAAAFLTRPLPCNGVAGRTIGGLAWVRRLAASGS